MYVIQKTYNKKNIELSNNRNIVVVVPSASSLEIKKFNELVREAVNEYNNDNEKYELIFLNNSDTERSAEKNFEKIYNATIVIAECTEKKPNVFYLLGIAHSIGKPVCSCYKIKNDSVLDIPFNVHGRQSVTYTLKTMSLQKEFKEKLKEWISMI